MMRILLQQKDTGFYLQDDGAWTRDSAEAMDFLSSTRAIDFCAAHKISGVQLVLKFEEQHYDIVLPMVLDRSLRQGPLRA
jgi:hypothetical protein